MFKITRINHVAVCVSDLDQAEDKFKKLGLVPSGREYVESQRTEVSFFPVGESNIELIKPAGNAGLEKFLEKRGQGIHHLALEVDHLAPALELLRALGVELLDQEPRPGAHGTKVAFLHPKALGGVLVELVEKGEDSSHDSA